MPRPLKQSRLFDSHFKIVTTTLFLISLFPPCMSAQDISAEDIEMPQRGICAHRGASTTHPENTLTAFEEAIRLGCQMIEFDVAITKDNEIVLMHDLTIDRTTNGTGKVADLTLAELKTFDAGSYKDQKFAGIKIPTLSETLKIMPKNIWLNVHLKGGDSLASETAKTIVEHSRLHQCFLACSHHAIQAARKVHPHIKHCNMDRQSNTLQYVEETISIQADFIQLLGGTSVDPQNVTAATREGIAVNFCCSNSADVIADLFESGVQFPLVDDVEKMIRTAEELGIPRLKPTY